MTPRQAVLVLAAKLGATVKTVCNADLKEVCVEAPAGKHWFDGGVCEFVWSDDGGEPMADAWADTLERMEAGLENCNECCGHLE